MTIRFSRPTPAFCAALFALFLLSAHLPGAPAPLTYRHSAPPPAPPPLPGQATLPGQSPASLSSSTPLHQAPAAATLYSHGDPTDEEQLYLEYINRARANANAEATRLAATTEPSVLNAINQFQVSLDQFIAQFATLTQVTQPLAFNETLLAIARLHSLDQFNNVFQGHTSSSQPPSPFTAGSDLGGRLNAGGFTTQRGTSRENVFSTASSVFYGHTGFEIDWGTGPFGMQSPPGHRNAIHSADSHEIGIGVHLGVRNQSARPAGVTVSGTSVFLQDVGPQVVTQVFSSRNAFPLFLTGVAYLDLDGNQFYSLGEGLANIQIEVQGVDFYTKTSASGGYAIPLPNTNGVYNLTISGPGFSALQDTVTVANNQSVKWDFKPAFSLPALTGPTSAPPGSAATYSTSSVPGANQYRIRLSRVQTGSWIEGAEGDASQYTATTTGTYSPTQSTVVGSGSKAFYLTHETFNDQFLTLNLDIIPSSTSNLTYKSRLSWADEDQIARTQISLDGGMNWTDLATQPGSTSSGENSFQNKSISLAAHAGKVIRLRFMYDTTGTIFPGPNFNPFVGWAIDDITVTDSTRLGENATLDIGTNRFTFNPPQAGSYLLETAPVNGERVFPYGPAMAITSTGAGGSGGSLLSSLAQAGITPAETAAIAFPTAVDLGSNWSYDPGLGLLNLAAYPWVYHLTGHQNQGAGWLYIYGPGGGEWVLFVPGLGWCYTRADTFPYFLRLTDGVWFYFSAEHSTPASRWFYRFGASAGWNNFTG